MTNDTDEILIYWRNALIGFLAFAGTFFLLSQCWSNDPFIESTIKALCAGGGYLIAAFALYFYKKRKT